MDLLTLDLQGNHLGHSPTIAEKRIYAAKKRREPNGSRLLPETQGPSRRITRGLS